MAWTKPEGDFGQNGPRKFVDFTNSTTFHGMKYIFEPSTIYRRFIWLCCVLTVIILFLVQVGYRSMDYLRYDTNVNVEVIYKGNLTFPAVTLCNQNSFRMTTAVDRQLYYFIDEAFGSSNATAMSASHLSAKYNTTHVDTREFLLSAAHQKQDLIDQCWWNGLQCNISTDFVTKETDFGTCYTFNVNKEKVKVVMESGAGFGLSLVLNVEQYEYMRGPENDAGVKVLLHDQREVPLVKDLGFAVAPGTHTLVGVRFYEVEGLPDPWGTCSQDSVTLAHCNTKCKAKEIIKRCHCRASYMPQPEDIPPTPICKTTQLFTCVRKNLSRINSAVAGCNCLVPCSQRIFGPSLSYAAISKFNADRVASEEPGRRQLLEKKFLNAREISQRVVLDTAKSNTLLLNKVLSSSAVFENLTTESMRELKDPKYLSAKHPKLLNVVDTALDMFNADFTVIRRVFVRRKGRSEGNEYVRFFNVMSAAEKARPTLDTFMQFNSSSNVSSLVLNLQACAATLAGSGSTDFSQCVASNPAYWNQRLADARAVLDAIDTADNTSDFFGVFNKGYKLYREWAVYLTRDTASGENIKVHQVCLQTMHSMNATFNAIYGSVSVFNNSNDISQIMPKMMLLLGLEMAHSAEKVNKFFFQVCNWPSDNGLWMTVDFYMETLMSQVLRDFQSMSAVYTQVVRTEEQIRDKFDSIMIPTKNLINGYYTKNNTLLDLAVHFESYFLTEGVVFLMDTVSTFHTQILQFDALFTRFEENAKKTFALSLNMTYGPLGWVPLLNDTVMSQLKLLAFAASRTENAELQAIAARWSINATATTYLYNIARILDIYMTSYRTYVKNLASDHTMRLRGLTAAINEAKLQMAKYLQNSKMDEKFFLENFIKLDIFYQELSVETIQQQEAFIFLSLLSEIGGFMGLLLGASVLTVIEVFDFIILRLAWMCYKGRETVTPLQVKPANQSSEEKPAIALSKPYKTPFTFKT